MTEKQVIKHFEETGALLTGHFELRSKLHSDRYFQCANVLRYPRIAEKLCKEVTLRAVKSGKLGKRIDGVISPAVGGILVGHEVARVLNVKCVFAEKVQDGDKKDATGKPVTKLAMRRFALKKGERYVVAEDVVTKGGRVQETIDLVKAAGATLLRGGAFKPRTSPYAFQGLKDAGIQLLLKAKKASGLPIITEIMNTRALELFEDVDIIQVGARNMQNFDMLQELGKTKKPILLKRGLANTLQELLMSAEYIMSEGNEQVILCERGIRTFETATRNTLDLSAVSVLHEMSHLPVVVDPSHATGKAKLVAPMAAAATAAGADGLMIEVHNNPACALCDGAQSLTPAQFAVMQEKVQRIREVIV